MGAGEVGRVDFAAGKLQEIRNRDALMAPVMRSDRISQITCDLWSESGLVQSDQKNGEEGKKL